MRTSWGRSLAIVLLGVAPVWGSNKAQVTLLSSVDAVVPGKPFEVGLRFEQEGEWHIYWQNSGDSGLAPNVHWSLPAGFVAADPLFPVPKRHVSPGDIITNILPGTPALLITVTPPATIAASSVKLSADVRYLICEKNCIQEEAAVELTLPVRAGGEAAVANGDVFKRARKALPLTESKYLKVAAVTNPPSPAAGSKFELKLNVEVAKGHHIQSHTPTIPSLIGANAFVERRPGIRFERPVFPEGKSRTDKFLGTLSEYEGAFTIVVPGESDADRKGPVNLTGVLSYQACDEIGHCFPPEAVSFSASAQFAEASSAPAAPTQGVTTAAPSPPTAKGGIEGFLEQYGIVGLLAGCFLYGLFINATPCVLPLLSIKVLGFVRQAHQSKKRALALGLSFGGGVMVFFVVLGLLAAAGTNILQLPEAVIGLGVVVMAMGLSMLGVFTLSPPSAAVNLESHIPQEGLFASFGKGALAPVLGFACTGPLLAGAFGWATQQPRETAIAAFLFMGLGMASPYMLLGARPNWLSFLPKPGQWMITFERIMGFLLLAMVIWLLHPLITQIGAEGLEWTLVFLIFVGLACWIFGQVRYDMSSARRWTLRGSAIGLALLVGGLIYEGIFPLSEAVAAAKAAREAAANCASHETSEDVNGLAWRPWSAKAVEETVRSGKLVFVDFTAAFCTVCKVNKKIAINTPEVIERIKSLGAVTFQGDFSTSDDAIFNELKRHGRAGVPLNLIFSPGKPETPIVLDPNLTKDYLLSKLDEATRVQSAAATAP